MTGEKASGILAVDQIRLVVERQQEVQNNEKHLDPREHCAFGGHFSYPQVLLHISFTISKVLLYS